jgi:hypothetical protein
MTVNNFTPTDIIKLIFSILTPFVPPILISIFSSFEFLEIILPEIRIFFLIAFIGTIYTVGMFLLSRFKRKITNKLDWTFRIVTIVVFFVYIVVFVIFLSMVVSGIIKNFTDEEIIFRARIAIGLLFFSVTFTICNYLFYSYRKIEQNSRAITCTCIPFQHTKDSNILYTFLVLNKAYTNARWMFPGGHFDIRIHDNLENIAIDKAKSEAGLEVGVISAKTPSYTGDKVRSLIIPHLFLGYKQDNSARCYYEKGHRFHFDYVYICDVSQENVHTPLYDVLKINIDINEILTKEYIDECIKEQLIKKQNEDNRNVGDYISEILLNACKDYCNAKSLKLKSSMGQSI